MSSLVYSFSVSLDGFLEGLDGDIAWSSPDPELHAHFNEQERSVAVALYGRNLYEMMARYWPTADRIPGALPEEVEYANIWRRMPKIVYSTTLQDVSWNAMLRREVVPDEIARLKAQSGGTISVGGAGLASSLLEYGLIDEFRLYVHPVILGSGKPMFGLLAQPVPLRLLQTHRFHSGVVLLRYEREETP